MGRRGNDMVTSLCENWEFTEGRAGGFYPNSKKAFRRGLLNVTR